MVHSAATTVTAYLDDLPPARREVVAAVRDLVNANLQPGFEETMAWGMVSWQVPLSRHPKTYNGQPLAFVGLAAQKNNYALYLMCADAGGQQALRDAYAAAGTKLDMGKGCLRFRTLDGLLAEPVAAMIASTSVDACIARHEASRTGGAAA